MKTIEKAVQPFIASDFDKETVYAENQSYASIIGLASTFPFGSEKKLIIVKQAEKLKEKKEKTEKKEIVNYFQSPTDFTVLVFIHDGTITNPASDPYKTLASEGYLFEAKELKGKKYEDKDLKKQRKQEAKEAKREKRKTKVKKHIKKKLVNKTKSKK